MIVTADIELHGDAVDRITQHVEEDHGFDSHSPDGINQMASHINAWNNRHRGLLDRIDQLRAESVQLETVNPTK